MKLKWWQWKRKGIDVKVRWFGELYDFVEVTPSHIEFKFEDLTLQVPVDYIKEIVLHESSRPDQSIRP